MDFGKLLGNIGSFLGFNKKKEEEKQQQRATVKAPTVPLGMQMPKQMNAGGVKMPEPFTIGNKPSNLPPQLGGVDMKPADGLSDADRKIVKDLSDRGKDTTAVVKSAREAKRLADKAAYDNSFVGLASKTAGTVAKDLAQGVARVPETLLRSALIEPLVGNATRTREQAVNTDSAENTGIRAFLYGKEPVKSYQSQTRDIQSGVSDFTGNKLLSNAAVVAGPVIAALDLATGGKGKTTLTAAKQGIKDIPDTFASKVDELMAGSIIPETQMRKYGWSEEQIDGALGRNKPEVQKLPTEQLEPISPSNPITSSPTTNKAPAVTSANPNFVPPVKVQAPQPFTPTGQVAGAPPVMGGVQPLQAAPMPSVSAPVASLADEQTAAAQALIDEATVAPPTPQAPVASAPIEAPSTTQARAIAEQTAPVDPQAVATAIKAEIASQAPTEAIASGVPDYTPPVGKYGKPSVPGTRSVTYTTGDGNLDGIVHDSIVAHKGQSKTAAQRADALDLAGVSASKRAKIRDVATRAVDKNTGQISPEGVDTIKRILASAETPRPTTPPKQLNEMPTDPPASNPIDTPPAGDPVPEGADKLGKITRNAVIDGSIRTQEGIDSALSRVEVAAKSEAEAAGASLEDIIRKGQKVWQKSKTEKRDLSTKEAQDLDKSFTPEQQRVYKEYAQEISTLRDRSGFSLTGGQQGEWYGPRQSLTEDGASAEFDPSMVNEIKRNRDQVSGGVDDANLDTSTTPHQQAIQRYANAPDASSRVLVETVETNLDTGAPSGIKVPDEAKQRLEASMESIIDKRDKALKLESEGDTVAANALRKEVSDDVNKTFNDFIDDIPGTGKQRREAINNVKDIRNTYMQTTMQTLSLSNVVNRVADTGAKIVYKATRPLAKKLEKGLAGKYEKVANETAPGVDAVKLNTSKEARKAARNFAKGTLGREVRDNFKANMSLAGAGRGVVGKTIAKIDALPRAANSALTQGAGDLSTQNIERALELGASRPEAKDLKTVEDYTKYFAEYVNSNNFKQDLDAARTDNNPRIGLAGARDDNMESAGWLAKRASKYLDNGVRTAGEAAGIKPNRLLDEANDYVKGNITGYAGVGTRVLGRTLDSATLGGLRRATKIAKSGKENAAAQATQVAAQGVADTIATYGVAGAAVAITAASNGAIGFTGDQPVQGSSDSALNKANNVPANQWYINVGNNRLYFDPARPLGAPGAAANVAGAVMTGKSATSAASSAGGQILAQAGGSSLPENFENVRKGYLDPTQQEGSKAYAQKQTEAMLAPSTGILNNIANWTDNKRRAPENFVENIKSNVPVLRGSVPVAKDSRGKEISNSKVVSGGSGLFSIGKNTDSAEVQAEDPIGTEINRLQKISGEVFPTNQSKNAKLKSTDEFAGLLLDSKVYQSGDDTAKAAFMKDVLGGTTIKDINTSIDTDSKKALLDYALLDEKKGKVWLEDNDNAASYYKAAYSNGDANGTLTTKDKSLREKDGLAYKAGVAKVNQEYGVDSTFKELYNDISQSDFKDMLDPESEYYDQATAEKLLAYDEARTKAGVSGHKFTDRAKFSLKAALKGLGGKGGGGGDNFAFASLPASLLGNSSGGGKSSYADGAPTFKPMADLKAPATVAIPKGRTISVKKGITL